MKGFKRLIIIYLSVFLITTLIGSILLYIPWSGKTHISFIDSFFLATSAFTVTGLSTVDMPQTFNGLGEMVILILIQIGGLGIITVMLFAFAITQRHISLQSRSLLMITWNEDQSGGVVRMLYQLIIYSLVVEFFRFLFLMLTFVPEYGLAKGSFISLFTSVSAFNNAGFSLFSDSLMPFVSDPIVNIVVSLLIILGGLGPLVVFNLATTKRFSKLTLHTKVVLTMTGVLILIGTFFYFVLEYSNTLEGMGLPEKLLASLFQSVSTRTAGFNTIDMGALNSPTYLITFILMFIGAAPISSAGGIKVTSFALILLFMWSTINGTKRPHMFKRTINQNVINKALLIGMSSLFLIFTMTILVASFEPKFNLMQIMFEIVSAFGTVGLSTGITPDLTLPSKILIIILMIIGKIGILTFLNLLKEPQNNQYYYSEGKLHL
ncbi:TrkH family potassium uptake protein [Staphylococcus massiliensis]|uniref:TrkH family potassium uptake protein n=3 Tax=Staphylococcus massiliensis TaxID=555791 RepID=UPI001EDF9625|nr:potassium transporter TrkG [Staphylococcus massiliensis]MCG3400774.1 TrkH family potassium uptake protein [Staphylococcus massiliensis]